MKQILSFALALVLVGGVLTGCGCSANVSDHPGGMITEETHVRPHPTATHETTHPTETIGPRETTLPTLPMTEPTSPTGDATATTDAARQNRGAVR